MSISSEIKQKKNIWLDYTKNILEYISAAKETAIEIEKLDKGKSYDSLTKRCLEESIPMLLSFKKKIDNHIEILEDMDKNIPENVFESYRERMSQKEEEIPKTEEQWRKNREYRTIANNIWEVSHEDEYPWGEDDDDEDIVTTQRKRDIHCPISLAVMKHPYRSKQCGHSFDKQSIFDHLKNRGTSRCPMKGCRKSISENDLERDVEMERMIDEELKNKEKEREKNDNVKSLDSDSDSDIDM